MQKALELDWRSSTKVQVHIGDYPCHGRQYHDYTSTDFDTYLADGRSIWCAADNNGRTPLKQCNTFVGVMLETGNSAESRVTCV